MTDPIDTLLAERDALRRENERLVGELAVAVNRATNLAVQLAAAQARANELERALMARTVGGMQ